VDVGQIEIPDLRAHEQVATLDLYATSLLAYGRETEAIAMWQRILDEHPTTSRYGQIEAKVANAAGVRAPELQRAIDRCDEMGLMTGVSAALGDHIRGDDVAPFESLAADVIAGCGSARAVPRIPALTLFNGGVLVALRAEDCTNAEAFAAMHVLNDPSQSNLYDNMLAPCR